MKWILYGRAIEGSSCTSIYLVILMTSEAHRNALLRVLNESYVTGNTNSQELEHVVGQVLATNRITFIEDELIHDGTSYIRSLHIIVGCRGMIVRRVWQWFCSDVCPWLLLIAWVSIDLPLRKRNDGKSLWWLKNYNYERDWSRLDISLFQFEVSFVVVDIQLNSTCCYGAHRVIPQVRLLLACIKRWNLSSVADSSQSWWKKNPDNSCTLIAFVDAQDKRRRSRSWKKY